MNNLKQLLIATIGLIFTFSNLKAQSGCFSRIDSIKSSVPNIYLDSRAIAADSKGNYYITGGRMSDTMYYNGNIFTGEGTIYLTKFNKNHQLVWNMKGSSRQDLGFGAAIAIDNNNNVIVGGDYERLLTFGKDTLTNQNGGYNNAFISKFRPDGTPIWSKRVHTPGLISAGQVISLTTDGFGNIYFGGSFGGSLIFGQDTIQNKGFSDNFWGKMDSLGNIQWIKAAGSKLVETGVNVAADSIGNLYVLGGLTNTNDSAYVDDTLNFKGFGFIAKYSSSGKMKWLKGAEKGNFYMGKRATGGKIQYKNGTVVAIGSMYSDSGIVSIAGVQATFDSSKGPVFAIKLDTKGNGQWLNAIIWSSSSVSIDGMGVAIKNNGNIALTTHEGEIIEGDTLNLTYATPIYLTVDGTNGKVINYCYPNQPGNGSYLSRGITSINDTVFATGSFDLKTNGQRRIFIATIPPISVGIKEQYIENQTITIYPNPSYNGAFALDLSEVTDAKFNQLTVFNLKGQMVYAQKIEAKNASKISFQLDNLSKGMYFISVESNKGVITKKLVVQ